MTIKPLQPNWGIETKISESQYGDGNTTIDYQNGCDNSIKVYQSSGGSYNTPPVNLPTPKCPQGQHGC